MSHTFEPRAFSSLSTSSLARRVAVASRVEHLAVAVIERTHALRGDNGAIKLRKRALVDLMSELKDSGFSYLAAAVSQVQCQCQCQRETSRIQHR